MPAVVVCGHANHLVCKLGFASKFGFGEGGHVDDGAAEGAVHIAFGAGRELRALFFFFFVSTLIRKRIEFWGKRRTHADQGSAVM